MRDSVGTWVEMKVETPFMDAEELEGHMPLVIADGLYRWYWSVEGDPVFGGDAPNAVYEQIESRKKR